MKSILITNNPLVNEKFSDKIETVYEKNFSYLELLIYARDEVHKGRALLTHPLSSSIKPNETPYKSILVTKQKSAIDFDSVKIIEDCIAACKKFLENKKLPNWTSKIRQDFMLVDYDLISHPIELSLQGH